MVLPWRREWKLISICFRITMWMESFFGHPFLIVRVRVRYQPQSLRYCAHSCSFSQGALPPCTLHPLHPVSERILPLEWLLHTLGCSPGLTYFFWLHVPLSPVLPLHVLVPLCSCFRMTRFGLGVGLQNYHCPSLRPLYADIICRWYHLNGRKWRGNKEPLEGERGEWKSWLKTQHSKN